MVRAEQCRGGDHLQSAGRRAALADAMRDWKRLAEGCDDSGLAEVGGLMGRYAPHPPRDCLSIAKLGALAEVQIASSPQYGTPARAVFASLGVFGSAAPPA